MEQIYDYNCIVLPISWCYTCGCNAARILATRLPLMKTKFGVGIEMNVFEGTAFVQLSENDIGDNEKFDAPDKLTANKNFIVMSDE